MKNRYQASSIFCLILILTCGCGRDEKKRSAGNKKSLKAVEKSLKAVEKNYLYLNNGIPRGILRAECKDCQLKYTINDIAFSIVVKNGNKDRFFYPLPNTYMSTTVRSNEDQLIRILIIDPNGNIISNTLNKYKKDDLVKKRFLISYKREPNMAVIRSSIPESYFEID